ncbi:UNVERIFIED_CONTAM: hypothetical protein RMT77_001425 [Armadillidium vulgare]
MKAINDIEILRYHLLIQFVIHECKYFMHDTAPCHAPKVEKIFLNQKEINVLEWPGNFQDLNPFENAWNLMKNKVQERRSCNIREMEEELKNIWINMDNSYFVSLAKCTPKRLENVSKSKGHMTKY